MAINIEISSKESARIVNILILREFLIFIKIFIKNADKGVPKRFLERFLESFLKAFSANRS